MFRAGTDTWPGARRWNGFREEKSTTQMRLQVHNQLTPSDTTPVPDKLAEPLTTESKLSEQAGKSRSHLKRLLFRASSNSPVCITDRTAKLCDGKSMMIEFPTTNLDAVLVQ
jgi:hypothetical protein